MTGKAVISLSTGLEDPEKVAVAFLVAVGAAESGRPTLTFQTKEAVRFALDGVAVGAACDGCPALPGRRASSLVSDVARLSSKVAKLLPRPQDFPPVS